MDADGKMVTYVCHRTYEKSPKLSKMSLNKHGQYDL